MLSTLRLMTVLSLALGALVAQGPAETPKPKPAPKKDMGGTAFIEMNRVFRESKATSDGLEKAREARTAKREALSKRVKEIATLEAEQEKFAPGSTDFFNIRGKIEKLNATLQLEDKIISVEYDLAVVRLIRASYARIRTEAAAIATDRGFEAVAIYSDGELGGRTYREALGDILTRTFLWMDAGRDITDQIIERINR